MVRKSQNRKAEIINSAIELIAHEGIQNLTIKNLASRVGVTEGALYRHFTGKMEILISILETFDKMTDDLLDEIKNMSYTPIKRLELFFINRFVQFNANPEFASVIFAEEVFQNDPRLVERILKIMRKNDDFIKRVITAGQKEGEIRADVDPEQLSLVAMGAIRLIVSRWHMLSFDFDLIKEGKQLWYTIKKLIQPKNK